MPARILPDPPCHCEGAKRPQQSPATAGAMPASVSLRQSRRLLCRLRRLAMTDGEQCHCEALPLRRSNLPRQRNPCLATNNTLATNTQACGPHPFYGPLSPLFTLSKIIMHLIRYVGNAVVMGVKWHPSVFV